MSLNGITEISIEHPVAKAYVESLFWKNEFSKVLLGDFSSFKFTAIVPMNFDLIKPIDLNGPLHGIRDDSDWVAEVIRSKLAAFQRPVLIVEDRQARESDFAELFGKIFHSEWRLNSAIYQASLEGDLSRTIEHLCNICLSFEPIIIVIEDSKFLAPSPIQSDEAAFVIVPVFDEDSFLIGRSGKLL